MLLLALYQGKNIYSPVAVAMLFFSFLDCFEPYLAQNNVFAVLLLNYDVFLHWIKVFANFQLITLIVPTSHSKERFCCFVAKLHFFSFFALEKGFCLFAANHVDSNYTSLTTPFLYFCC